MHHSTAGPRLVMFPDMELEVAVAVTSIVSQAQPLMAINSRECSKPR